MREFRVTLTHRAGELARLTDLLAQRGLNLKSVAGVSDGQKATLCLVAEDVTAMRSALADARIPFDEAEVISEFLEHEPGQLADLAAKLMDAGVNVNSIYVLARDEPLIEIGMTVDDAKRAKKALAG